MVACNFIVEEKPDVVVHVVDASNLERNMYLFTQLSEMDAPVVLAMNMSDMVEGKGCTINYEMLSKSLGRPVVQTVGNKNKGMDELLKTVVAVYEKEIKVSKVKVDYGLEIDLERTKVAQVLSRNNVEVNGYFKNCFEASEEDLIVERHRWV